MNYFEHHIGDYAQATSHLSFVEDAAYHRIIRKYYADERPVPADIKAVQRLVGARTKEEREAVETVLSEFFELRDGGWHQRRCDAEIARFQDKRAKAKRSAEKRWGGDAQQHERIGPDMPPHCNGDANALPTQCEGNAPKHQAPSTKHQAPDLVGNSSARTEASQAATPEARACLLMREAGCVQVNPAHPDLIAAIAEGVTPEALAHTAGEAVAARKRSPFAWAISAARGRHADGRNPIQPAGEIHAASQPGRPLSAAERVAAINAAAELRERNTIDGECRVVAG